MWTKQNLYRKSDKKQNINNKFDKSELAASK